MVDWLENAIESILDPQDGGEPFYYWWDDMRPKEVRELVMDAYKRGTNRQQALIELCRKLCEALNADASMNDQAFWHLCKLAEQVQCTHLPWWDYLYMKKGS